MDQIFIGKGNHTIIYEILWFDVFDDLKSYKHAVRFSGCKLKSYLYILFTIHKCFPGSWS